MESVLILFPICLSKSQRPMGDRESQVIPRNFIPVKPFHLKAFRARFEVRFFHPCEVLDVYLADTWEVDRDKWLDDFDVGFRFFPSFPDSAFD